MASTAGHAHWYLAPINSIRATHRSGDYTCGTKSIRNTNKVGEFLGNTYIVYHNEDYAYALFSDETMNKVCEFLGKGGFGEVRVGEHQVTGERVALKFLRKSAIADMGAAERTTTEVQCEHNTNPFGVFVGLQHAMKGKRVESKRRNAASTTQSCPGCWGWR